MPCAYYNEYDRNAAAWLRELIRRGLIASGDVDERSIVDVRAEDLRGYTQCHFFAGIGTWSYALRLAGWNDARPVWTASLPCQPFSAAGKQSGAADERNLAEVWLRLASECRPAIAFGEQVEPAIGFGWLDAVFIRLEQSGYACGAAVFPAASVGAPHIRSRLYWAADSGGKRRQQDTGSASGDEAAHGRARWQQRESDGDHFAIGDGPTLAVANAEHSERRPQRGPGEDERNWNDAGRAQAHSESRARSALRPVADPPSEGTTRGLGEQDGARNARGAESAGGGAVDELGDPSFDRKRAQHGESSEGARRKSSHRGSSVSGATAGFWANAEWLPCRDGKARPVEPGTSPLVDGTPARVVRLRGYGNGIVAQAAEAFIETVMECI